MTKHKSLIAAAATLLILPTLLTLLLAVSGLVFFRENPLPTPAEDARILEVPVFLPLTGPIAVYGQWTMDAIALSAAEVNARSPVKLKFDFIDTTGSAKEAVTAYQQRMSRATPPLVVAAITGPVFAMAPLTEKRGQILFATVVTHPEVTARGKNVFRHFINKGTGAVALAHAAIQSGIKEVSLVYINEDGGLAEKRAFESKFRELGGTIKNEYTFEKTTTDYRDLLAKIRSADDKYLMLSGYGASYAAFLKQMREQRLKATLLTSADVVDPYIEGLAGPPVPGTIYYNPLNDTDTPTYQQFAAQYRTAYGTEPPFYSGFGYDIPLMLEQTLKAEGNKTDAGSLRAGLLNIRDLQGVYGTINVGPDRDTKFTYPVFKIGNDGKPIRID